MRVRVQFVLRDINDIDDERETFDFGGVLSLEWQDPRQAFDPAAAGTDEKVFQGDYQFNELFAGWFPQVVLANESGSFEKHGVLLRVRHDGTLRLLQTVSATAEADLDLRLYPFDRQRLEASFEVLGFDDRTVLLEEGTREDPLAGPIWIPQWTLVEAAGSVRPRTASYVGGSGTASTYVLRMDLQRQSFFMVRLIVLPLGLIVILSWVVFWMDRSSLGDRVNVSFIGILTAVAYQIVVSELVPHISYYTIMNGFLNLSMLVMCATVVVNLLVGYYDQRGRSDVGDRVDRHSRWVFPVAYFGLGALMCGVAFTLYD